MAEETPPAAKTSAVVGIGKPFSAKEAKEMDGVDAETRLFHGIDPETKERVSVTIEGLKAQFGDKEGERKYVEIAGIAGGSVFFNPRTEATSFRPPLGIGGLGRSKKELQTQFGAEEGARRFEVNQKHAAKVAEILASTEEE